MISAEIIEDSVANGKRITTYLLRYPRMVHAEVMTHRAFSRNASSSRAIPLKRMLASIKKDMAKPIEWGSNKPGMQAGVQLTGFKLLTAKAIWSLTGHIVIFMSKLLGMTGVHKQIVNRLAEPFAHITVVVTATEWANFFALRYHPMAQPEIRELAKLMWERRIESMPKVSHARYPATWHLPFVPIEEREFCCTEDNITKSVARCARTSYDKHDGRTPHLYEDIGLYNRLLGSTPIHASPAEHQAWPAAGPESRSGNFIGWIQYRQTLDDQNITLFKEPDGNSK